MCVRVCLLVFTGMVCTCVVHVYGGGCVRVFVWQYKTYVECKYICVYAHACLCTGTHMRFKL